MLAMLFAITMIGENPPDPTKAAAAALRAHDYGIAGVSSFWGNVQAQGENWRPYGIKCSILPKAVYAYGYFVSDAIDREAFDGYRKQVAFLVTYNGIMLKSGKLPRAWNCATDNDPDPLG